MQGEREAERQEEHGTGEKAKLLDRGDSEDSLVTRDVPKLVYQ